MAPTSDHPSAHRQLTDAEIAGVVLGAAFLAAFCVLCVWLGLRTIRKRDEPKLALESAPPSGLGNHASVTACPPSEDEGPVTRIARSRSQRRRSRNFGPHTMNTYAYEKDASPVLSSQAGFDFGFQPPTSN